MNTALSVYADTLRREKKQILVLDIHQNLDYLCIVTLILKCDKNMLNVGKTNSTQFDYILALTEFEPTRPKFYQEIQHLTEYVAQGMCSINISMLNFLAASEKKQMTTLNKWHENNQVSHDTAIGAFCENSSITYKQINN